MKFNFDGLTYLVVSLLFLVIFLIGISLFPSSYANLELNLGTELLGIIIVISVVDWIIKRNDAIKWAKTKQIIINKIEIFNNNYNSQVREFFSIAHPFFPTELEPTSENIKKIALDLLEHSEKEIFPTITHRIQDVSEENWNKFILELNETNDSIIQILLLFQNKIDPEIYSELLDIQMIIEKNLRYSLLIPFIIKPENPEHYLLGEQIKTTFAENLKDSLEIAINLNKKLIE